MNKKYLIITTVLVFITGVGLIGGVPLVWPSNDMIFQVPKGYTKHELISGNSARLIGWASNTNFDTTIILLHGIRSNKLALLPRAKYFVNKGFNVVLFDHQSHGESSGVRITAGYLESLDVESITSFAHKNYKTKDVGVIGVSMGGSAAVYSSKNISIQWLVLEQVYPRMTNAVNNRLKERLGILSKLVYPILEFQSGYLIGKSIKDLNPETSAQNIKVPTLVIGGSMDNKTPPDETLRLFQGVGSKQKKMHLVEIGHDDIFSNNKEVYENVILNFIRSVD